MAWAPSLALQCSQRCWRCEHFAGIEGRRAAQTLFRRSAYLLNLPAAIRPFLNLRRLPDSPCVRAAGGIDWAGAILGANMARNENTPNALANCQVLLVEDEAIIAL